MELLTFLTLIRTFFFVIFYLFIEFITKFIIRKNISVTWREKVEYFQSSFSEPTYLLEGLFVL